MSLLDIIVRAEIDASPVTFYIRWTFAADCKAVQVGGRVTRQSYQSQEKEYLLDRFGPLSSSLHDYLFVLNISAGVLRTQGVDLVIISNGDYEMIKSFRNPFVGYADPGTHQVHNVLAMIHSLEKGPRAAYVRHGNASGIRMVIANAAKGGDASLEEGRGHFTAW
ncbi:hypothetical protein MPER_01028 [Moniliophthora perniciosa FA553]|nr:hypothetical protein MPER_01028 [Moniliophthora perniciosa FA553]